MGRAVSKFLIFITKVFDKFRTKYDSGKLERKKKFSQCILKRIGQSKSLIISLALGCIARACTIKRFMPVISVRILYASVFITESHFQSSLIVTSKARDNPSKAP